MCEHHLYGLQNGLGRHRQMLDDMAVPWLPGAYIGKNIVLASYPPAHSVGEDVLGVRDPVDHFLASTTGLEYNLGSLDILVIEPSKKRKTCDVFGNGIVAFFETEILSLKSRPSGRLVSETLANKSNDLRGTSGLGSLR